MEQIDINLLKYIQWWFHSDFMDTVMPIVRNKTTWIPLYIVLLVYLYRRYSTKSFFFIVGTTLLLIAVSDGLCAQVMKPMFHRIRPCVALLNTPDFYDYGLCSKTFSMPSCHATNHMAIATYMAYFIRNIYLRNFLFFWVLIVVLGQMYVGVHYPSDILVGLILGYLLAKTMRIVSIRTKFSHLYHPV